jgi:hypothetical protein
LWIGARARHRDEIDGPDVPGLHAEIRASGLFLREIDEIDGNATKERVRVVAVARAVQ